MNTRYGTDFRIGTTSYIYPDDIIPNVRRLCERVDDIELVLFETPEAGNLPDAATLDELAAISRGCGLTYTPHLPLDINLGSADGAVRDASIDLAARLIDRLSSLNPPAYILHVNGGEHTCAGILDWQHRAGESLGRLVGSIGVNPALIAVENLAYPFHHIAGVVAERGLSVCIDIGHLVAAGSDVGAHLRDHLPRTRAMHLHGVNEERDHVSLRHLESGFLAWLTEALLTEHYGGVLTLEIFSERDFEESLDLLVGHCAGKR